MGYKINKIIIQNFKVFNIDIENNSYYDKTMSRDLQILTGQNGYGKSSIYDAIELVLTGRINRLYDVSGRAVSFNDNLIANNKEKDLLVGLELCNSDNGKYLSILKHIPRNKIKPEKESRLDKWFDTYISEEEFCKENLINKNNKVNNKCVSLEISKHLEIEPEYFYINYIQQQDPINFLKRKEEDRKEIIEKLLQTNNIKGETYSKIEEKINQYEAKYEELKNEVISKKQNIIKEINNTIEEKPKYIHLFKNKSIDWDLEKEKIGHNKYKDELNNIRKFIQNYKDYMKVIQVEKLNKYKSNTAIVDEISYYLKYEKILNTIKVEKNIYDKTQNLIVNINNNNWSNINVEDYKSFIADDLLIKISNIKQDLNNLNKMKTENSSTILAFNETRENFLGKFKNEIKLENPNLDLNKCPLCGVSYNSAESLLNSINEYTDKIKSLLSDIDKSIDNIRQNINLNIKNLKESLDIIIKGLLIKDKNEYDRILKNLNNIEVVKNNIENLKKLGINLLEVFDDSENIDISTIKKIVLEKITETASNIDISNCNDIILDKKTFDKIYNEYFDNSSQNLISIEDIIKKEAFLDYCYNYNLIEKNHKNTKDISELKKQMVISKLKFDKFKKMKEEYDKCINNYTVKIISKIEIPLYIYTGKILQNHPKGLGVFCYLGPDPNNKITRLKFIGNMETSHDIVNTFSSGQLAGFIISFTLAMKKVYNNKLDVIMIDDPVQTMDELNLISFTEILRNEFSDKQVILSTHESNIAGYIDYKYRKYGLDSSIIDVRKEFD